MWDAKWVVDWHSDCDETCVGVGVIVQFEDSTSSPPARTGGVDDGPVEGQRTATVPGSVGNHDDDTVEGGYKGRGHNVGGLGAV